MLLGLSTEYAVLLCSQKRDAEMTSEARKSRCRRTVDQGADLAQFTVKLATSDVSSGEAAVG
jgi:hypothetical protein